MPAQKEQPKQHTVDATGEVFGRLATRVATLLRGKHKPTFVPHIDGGDAVRVQHLAGARFTGTKYETKLYHRHTGHPGGLRTSSLRKRWETAPEDVFRDAVRGMLPANKLRDGMLKRLTIER